MITVTIITITCIIVMIITDNNNVLITDNNRYESRRINKTEN